MYNNKSCNWLYQNIEEISQLSGAWSTFKPTEYVFETQ